MQTVAINSVIISKDGMAHGRATGRIRKCCIDCKTHSNECEVVWGDDNGSDLLTNWVCIGTLRVHQPNVVPPVYIVVSVQEGIDALGEHEQSVLLDMPTAVAFLGTILGAPLYGVVPTMPSPYLKEVIEFNNGDRTFDNAQVEAWIDAAQLLVRKDWKTK